MGGIMSIFNCQKSNTAKIDKQEKAIIDCKLTRDKIKNYIKRLQKNESLKKEKAKEALKNRDKDRARMLLMQSKMFKEQIASANGQLVMIEDSITQIETARVQKEALKVLEQGNNVLKDLYKEVNIEKWEKIGDDMNDIKQQQEEIGNFLKSHNIQESDYNEEIDKELQTLMKSENVAVEEFPEAGKTEISKKQKESLQAIEA